ncbi:tyrosine-type recombinase/integrase [Vibrio mimicus]|uniref:tyrosine-type recombinase/integrase n=1 Tax=Vibrio mimicus TaxID=674 RepID=UPI002F928D81
MNFAVNSGYIEHSPLSGIRDVFKKPIVERMKAHSSDEISDLMRALGHANLYITTRYLIELQLHTMTRPSEVAGARWDEIDFNTNTWNIPSTTLNEWGEDPDLSEVASAHVGRDRIRNAYNRTDYLERRREMMQKWSSYISENSMGSFSVLNVMQDR